MIGGADPSVMSKSASEAASSLARSSFSQSPLISIIDPLFDKMTQSTHIPSFVYHIFLLQLFIQLAYISSWPFHTDLWYQNDISKSFLLYFGCIASFSPLFKTKDDLIISFIIYTIIFVINLFSFIFQVLFFHKYRQFNKKSLYPTRILMELFTLILMIPFGHITGTLFIKLTVDKDASIINIVLFVISFIELILTISFFYCFSSLFGSSVYLSLSPFDAFNHSLYVNLCFISSIFILLGKCFEFFPKWSEQALIAIHIVFMIYMIIEFGRSPFVKYSSNVLFMGICIGSASNDLMRFISGFFTNINGLISFIVFIVLIILGFVSSIIYFFLMTRKMKKSLLFESNTDDKNYIPTEDEKIERLLFLKLDSNEKKALQYLDYIISNHVVSFLDFLIFKFITQNYGSTSTLCHCIRIVVCLPCSGRNLNLLYNEAVKRRDMKFNQRFLLSQVQKIKLLRQSASSTQIGERIKNLRQHTKELQNSMKGFWNETSPDLAFLMSTSAILKKTKSLWNETLAEFPNSIQYIEESIFFQIECNCDFISAIKSRHKIDLIESGKNFNVDLSFRQFVRSFPEYLKKGIIDAKGNFIYDQKTVKTGGNQSSTSTDSNSTGSSSKNFSTSSSSMSELEVAIEEGIGKVLINQSRIRLALQRATETKKANRYFTFLISTLFLFAAGFIISIALFIIFDSYFNGRLSIAERISLINQARLYLFETTLMIVYHWGQSVNVTQIDKVLEEILTQEDANEISSFMDAHLDVSYSMRAANFGFLLKTKYHDFLSDVAEQSRLGVDMYKYTAPIFEETSSINFTDYGKVYESNISYNLKTVITYMSFLCSILMGETNETILKSYYTDSRYFGTLITTIQYSTDSFDVIKDTLSIMSEDEAEASRELLKILSISLVLVYGAVSVILTVLMGVLYIKEIKKFATMLLDLPHKVKHESIQPIRKITNQLNNNEESLIENVESAGSKSITSIATLVIICILYVAIAVVIFFQIENIRIYNTNYMYLNLWQASSRIRKSYVAQLCLWISQAIILSNPLVNTTNFLNYENLKNLIEKDLKLLDEATTDMLQDSKDYPSPIGISDIIDKYTLQGSCEMNKNISSFHEQYRCGSLQNLLAFFLNIVDQVIAKLDQYSGYINGEIPSQIVHLANNHLIPLLIKIDDSWSVVGTDFQTAYMTNHILFFVIELVIEALTLLLSYYLMIVLNDSYIIVLTLLRRVNPVSVAASPELINYLLDKSTTQNSMTMSTSQAIIFNSTDSVLFLGTNGVVDILNPSVTTMFGYTPEQLLGQSVVTVFDEDSKSKSQIEQQIELMKNHQSALTYEDHTVCISDRDEKIPCCITIIGIVNADNEIESFVIILRDESELIAQQKQAEEAKKTSESLLYQILPRSIVVRLNQGEKDITFTVPSATIMFIDIVKFSDYAVSLTPQEIMGNLSLIFAGFDESITQYEMLTKIKLIGDVYMCAGGLFSPEEQPVTHAEQMIKFGHECLQVLEDSNVKLNAMLNVRIGINTGGPLIAGVLGTDKPTFDIIGDPINIASRLQSTDVPGRIQISQNTYELINQLDFLIEARGDVFLKGKGKQPAYFVSALKPFNMSSSNPDGKLE